MSFFLFLFIINNTVFQQGIDEIGLLLYKNLAEIVKFLEAMIKININRRLVSLVGKAPVYRAGRSGSIPDRTNTQGLKIIEEKVLPLL